MTQKRKKFALILLLTVFNNICILLIIYCGISKYLKSYDPICDLKTAIWSEPWVLCFKCSLLNEFVFLNKSFVQMIQ